ncbi:DNA-binding protein [Candidatus Bathyarchaeota archaeon]|nr:MAG: DNA-binding protein [Candidatus Bathyarchaeota archaeon]
MLIMSSSNATKILINRSKSFLEAAKENFLRGLYDVACFEADQAVQLMLKAYLLKYGGFIPRTHSVRKLLGELGKVLGKIGEVKKFISENRSGLVMLEDVYMRSRYSLEGYDASDAELCLNLASKIIDFVGKIVKI